MDVDDRRLSFFGLFLDPLSLPLFFGITADVAVDVCVRV